MKFFKGLMYALGIEILLAIAIVGTIQIAMWWIK
jgi:hypothetical protein